MLRHQPTQAGASRRKPTHQTAHILSPRRPRRSPSLGALCRSSIAATPGLGGSCAAGTGFAAPTSQPAARGASQSAASASNAPPVVRSRFAWLCVVCGGLIAVGAAAQWHPVPIGICIWRNPSREGSDCRRSRGKITALQLSAPRTAFSKRPGWNEVRDVGR